MLSDKEQEELFLCAAQHLNTMSELWKKGADFCLSADSASADRKERGFSNLRSYLRRSAEGEYARDVGLWLAPIDDYLKRGIRDGILTPKDKVDLYAEALLSGARLTKDDRKRLLSEESVRERVMEEISNMDSRRLEGNETIARLKKEVELYEHKAVMMGDNGSVKLKIAEVLGRKMAEGIEKGIKPSKKVSSEAKDRGTLREARERAEKRNMDPLAERARKYKAVQQK